MCERKGREKNHNMAEILGAATTATKYIFEVNQVTIDNATFKLFYKATTTLLLAFSLITCSKQFFGDPINCEVVSKIALLPSFDPEIESVDYFEP